MLLVSITLAAAALLERLPRCVTDLYHQVNEAPELFGMLLTPLFVFILVLWARWELDAGRSTRSPGQLDDLLCRKRLGLLQRAARRLRLGSARARRYASAGSFEQAVSEAANPLPTADMDRLVEKKRSGAWSPPTEGTPPAEEGCT
jgi:hypothetical protein